MSFDIERKFHATAAVALTSKRPVFVTGLARAGTTVLMRMLHHGGNFASLTYRDMPFPLAPNSWAHLGKRWNRSIATRERGHGDGLTHDLDTPEAIEEVFWRAFEGDRYIEKAGLVPSSPDQETLEDFQLFVRLVQLRYGRARYLSKNNNNVLRLPGLVSAFPDAVLIHPFREPLQQAASLLNQHRRACVTQANDPFRRKFMTWLGHREFGLDQRPFMFADAPPGGGDRQSINYWLQTWISVYRSLLRQPDPVSARQLFVDFDLLCAGDSQMPAILAKSVDADIPPMDILAPPPLHRAEGIDRELLAAAQALHTDLRAR
ncbi:sulfotransferase [soil metagenome]